MGLTDVGIGVGLERGRGVGDWGYLWAVIWRDFGEVGMGFVEGWGWWGGFWIGFVLGLVPKSLEILSR